MEDGGADVGEDTDVSDDPGLCGGGEDGLCGGGARWWVRYRFLKVCGELWEDLPNSFLFFFHVSRDVFLVSLKGEVVNLVEVLTDECVKVWE